jgi:Mn-dependent DtxR family transcriptional regulator
LTNRQTGSAKVEEETYGVVAGGSPVAFSTIAKDLGCTWRVVQKSVKWLAENDLITASGSRGVLNVFHLKETARTFEVKEQAPEEPQVDRPTVFHIEGDDDELA